MTTTVTNPDDLTALEADVPLIVVEKTEIADSIVRLVLGHAEDADLPDWRPGAHIDLRLAENLVRQYSLCGRTGDRTRWIVCVRHDPDGRGGSDYVHRFLDIGSRIVARGPRNHFPLTKARRYLFIAGGIGVTPLIPMLADADATGADWKMLYFGRTQSAMAYADELLSRYPDRVELRPEDTLGRPDVRELVRAAPPGCLIYACGPAGLLDALEDHAAQGERSRDLRMERFSATAHRSPAISFTVEFAQTGIEREVDADSTILEVATQAGVSVSYSCSEGTCGTCETAIISGDVDHRDVVLTADERQANETMMICVSRATCPRLVLDL